METERKFIGEDPFTPEEEDWFETDHSSEATVSALCGHFPHIADAIVLDIPCGRGFLANGLHSECKQLIGADINLTYLSKLEEGIVTLHQDIRRFSDSEHYDIILNWHNSFGYFDDTTNQSVLLRLYVALKKGGTLLIEGDNPRNMNDKYPVKPNKDLYWDENTMTLRYGYGTKELMLRIYTIEEMKERLRATGFRTINMYGNDFSPYREDSQRIIYEAIK